MYTNTKRKDRLGRKLWAFFTMVMLSFSIGQPLVQAAPWGLTAQLQDASRYTTTTMSLGYVPHSVIPDQSRIRLDFGYDYEINLNNVDPSDVSVTGANISASVATVDQFANTIDIVLTGTADASTPLDFTIQDFGTISASWRYYGIVKMFVYDSADTQLEYDYTSYSIQENTSIRLNSMQLSSPSLSMELETTTALEDQYYLDFEFPSFVYLGDVTPGDIQLTHPNITNYTVDLSQSQRIRVQLEVSGTTAGSPIAVSMDNIKVPKGQAMGSLSVTSYDATDSYIESGDKYIVILPDQYSTLTVAPTSNQAYTDNVTYNFTLDPRESYTQQYDEVYVEFPSGTYVNSNATVVSTNPNYTIDPMCQTCNPVSFRVLSDTGPTSGPLTFAINGIDNNSFIGTRTIKVSTNIDDRVDGNPEDGSSLRLGYEGEVEFSTMMNVQVRPDSLIASDQTSHRVYFRPGTDLEDGWQVVLQYPPEVDLTNVTAADVSVSVNTPTTLSNIVVNTTTNTISFEADFYSSTTSGDRMMVNINNVINPSAPGTYAVGVETRDNTMAHNVVDQGTGTFTIAAPFVVPVVVDVPYEATQSPFHLNGFVPGVVIKNYWYMRIVFPDDVDLSDVDSGDVYVETTPTNKISGFSNFTTDVANRYIQMEVNMTTGDSEGFPWNVDINDVITPSTAGTYNLQVLFFSPEWFSYENEDNVSDYSLLMQTQGEGEFIINAGGPPQLISATPANNATGIGLGPNHVYVIDDIDLGVDLTTLDMTVNGLDVYIDGVCQTVEFTCEAPEMSDPLGPNPNRVTIRFVPNNPYPSWSTIPVTLYVEDLGGAPLSRTLQFDTSEGLRDPYDLYTNDASVGAQSDYGSPAVFNGSSPVFSSRYYTTDGSPLTHYELQVSSDPTFADIDPAVRLVSTGKKSVLAPDAFSTGALDIGTFDPWGGRLPDIDITPTNPYQKDTSYYWRIRYWEENAHGNTPSNWANAEFVLEDRPYIVSATPANNATVRPGITTLTYVYDDDLEGVSTNGVDLTMEYYDSSWNYYLEPLIEDSVCNPTYTSACSVTDIGNGQVQISATLINPLLPQASYYIYTYVEDLVGNATNDSLYFYASSAPSAPEDLHANTVPNSTATAKISPAVFNDSDVRFGALHKNPLGDPATHYSIEVSTTWYFGTIDCDTGKVAISGGLADNARLDNIEVPGCVFNDNTDYYWRISFWNDNDQGPTADARFYIDPTADITPPTVTRTPLDGATNVPRNQTFVVTIADADSMVEVASVNVNIDGRVVVAAGVLNTTDFTFTQSPVGDDTSVTYEFTAVDPTVFDYGDTVNFSVQGNDTQGNSIPSGQQVTTFTFHTISGPTDTTPPTVTRVPADGATNVPRNQTFSVVMTDADSSVDISTVNIIVDGTNAVTGGVLNTTDFTFTQNPTVDGASVTYEFTAVDPTRFAYGDTVDFTVQGSDTVGNAITAGNQTTTFTFANETTPPTVTRVPADGATNVPRNQTFSVVIADTDSLVDISTVNITVASINVVTAGVLNTTDFTFTQNPTVDAASVTYEFTRITPAAFPLNTTVDFVVQGSDTVGNSIPVGDQTTTFTFENPDLTRPTVTRVPTNMTTNVPRNQTFSVTVSDIHSLVDISTVDITVNGTSIVTAGVLNTTDFTFTQNPTVDGASVTYEFTAVDPTIFPYGTLVSFIVDAADTAGNYVLPTSRTTWFTFENETTPPSVVRVPADGATNVPRNQTFSVVMTDGDSLVDISTVNIIVDGTNVVNAGVLNTTDFTFTNFPMLDGASVTYEFTAVDPTRFTYGDTVDFTVQGSDTVGNAITAGNQTTTFTFANETTPPSVTRIPADGATNVPRNQTFSVVMTDGDSLVDISTVNIIVDGTNVVTAGVLNTTDFTFTQNPTVDGASVTYEFTAVDPTRFTYGDTVDFTVQGSDTVGNAITAGNQTTTFTFANETTPPSVVRTPADGATNVPRNQTFSVVMTDADTLVDISTVNIIVDGTNAVTAGVLNTTDFTFTQNPTVDGASVTYEFTAVDPTRFTYGDTVDFTVQGSDTVGNAITAGDQTTTFTFADETTPPSVVRVPADGATNVPRNQTFSVVMTDADTLVDISTVNIIVDGTSIVTAGVLNTTDFTFTQNPTVDGASVTYEFTAVDPTRFTYGDTVDFTVQGSDTVGNAITAGNQTTTFTFANETTPPSVTRVPADGATNVPRNQTFSVVMTDGDSLVDISTVNIIVDGTNVVTAGVLNTTDFTFTQNPTVDGASVTYEFTAVDPTRFTYGDTVDFTVQGSDTVGNAITAGNQTTTFTLEAAPVVDVTPPTITQTPTNGTTNVPRTQSFVVTITDGEADVDITTVNITVAGSNVVTGGVLNTTDYTFTQFPMVNSPSVTYQFTRIDSTQFPYGALVNFDTNARDSNNNLATATTTFRFVNAPVVTPPSSGGSGGGGYISDYSVPETPRPSANENTNAPVDNQATCAFFEQQVASQKYGDINDSILNNYASFLLDNGIILGRNSVEFGSYDPMTRSEVLRSIIQANCEEFSLKDVTQRPFPDVATDHKDALFIDAAKRAGIVSGYKEDGTYRPDRFITRGEAVKVVFQEVLGDEIRVFDGKSHPFTDVQSSAWYVNYIRFGVEAGIIKDNPTHTLRPDQAITREDIAKLLVDTLRYKDRLGTSSERPAATPAVPQVPVTSPEPARPVVEKPAQDILKPENMVNIADVVREATPACSYFDDRLLTPEYGDIGNDKAMTDYAARLLTYGVVVGKNVSTFAPLDEITRSEILRIMIQANCETYTLQPVLEKPFPDVPVMHKDAVFIQAAKHAGIISGYGDGTFKPDSTISRAEILKILLEAALSKTFARFDGALQNYSDVPDHAWYARYLRFISTQKIMNDGEGSLFKPEVNGNRGFIASTLLKILEFKDKITGR